ncbi:hypothetical protein GOP47_0009313 [Adiantum capillus-veneris]|uniref:Uncharacterized protein n=1 Tax=Adiantum capillus-veneris TaxID=13818 RepID=A0A9D4UXJ8_ADICA|nr:hypothetical protein GOP47_0009313 [Adiantum capillus-veneris]
MPAGDPLPFSNRVTDLLDTSDICGSKPGSICKRPLRTCRLHCYIDDASFHPAKRTHVRRRTMFGQGLDLFDIDIGKRQFGFNRSIISNPLEPVYYSETEDLPHKSVCVVGIDLLRSPGIVTKFARPPLMYKPLVRISKARCQGTRCMAGIARIRGS